MRLAPELTIIIPAFNGAAYLGECLTSVLTQPFGDLECMLVDDGSTDDTAAVYSTYAARDPRLRYHRQKRAGLSAARNAGIARAAGRWLAFMDCDDYYLDYGIAALMALRRHDSARSVHVLAGLLTGNLFEARPARTRIRRRSLDLFLSTLRLDPSLPPLYVTATILHRDVIANVGMFSERYPGVEDRDFLARVAARYPVMSTTREVSFYREGHTQGLDERLTTSGATLSSLVRLYRNLPRRQSVIARRRSSVGQQSVFERMRLGYLNMLGAAEALNEAPKRAAMLLARAGRYCESPAELVLLVTNLGYFFRHPKSQPALAAARCAEKFRTLSKALPASEEGLQWLLEHTAALEEDR